MQRYRPSRFRLTVGAPLPAAFVDVCKQAGVPLDYDDVAGGVWADEQKIRGPDIVLPDESMQDAVRQLKGVWLGPSRTPEEEQRW